MDKNLIVSKINSEVQGSVLEVRRFGRSEIFSIWIEAQSVHKVASVLRADPEISLDWLENLSVVEFAECLVVSYFLQSTTRPHSQIVLRASVVPLSIDAEVEVPSIQAIWPMGAPMEQEANELFGVRFKSLPLERQFQSDFNLEGSLSRRLLPEVRGFPLRKKFVK